MEAVKLSDVVANMKNDYHREDDYDYDEDCRYENDFYYNRITREFKEMSNSDYYNMDEKEQNEWICLPYFTEYEDMMSDFVEESILRSKKEALVAILNSGMDVPRRFEEAIEREGLHHRWCSFINICQMKEAREWCKRNKIDYDRSERPDEEELKLKTGILIGKTATATTTVTEQNTAKAVGSGSLSVFATPMMIALMERAACECLAGSLEEGQTSVGVYVAAEHTAASLIGDVITATARIKSISEKGNRIEFSLYAKDEEKVIGIGEHTRVIVDEKRFLEKLRNR